MGNNYWKERSLPYKPGQETVFKVSRSKIELFTQCPRCFWLDVRHKITRPSTAPFNINKAIDELYKREFDVYRAQQKPHPIMTKHKLEAVPFKHKDINRWRENFVGVYVVHEGTNLHVFGAVDDVWLDGAGKVIVVDYKATSKDKEVSIDSDWQQTYKRQMEVYQWLLRQNGHDVSDTGYFVYTNADGSAKDFGDVLKFNTKLIPYTGSDDWVEKTIFDMKKCMEGEMPNVGVDIMGGPCSYCTYARSRTQLTLDAIQKK